MEQGQPPQIICKITSFPLPSSLPPLPPLILPSLSSPPLLWRGVGGEVYNQFLLKLKNKPQLTTVNSPHPTVNNPRISVNNQ
ncbi:hypothetical protein Barb4_00670 [Bacteroidales bacterium Barb4]|nr:hypothetical protein Barb4_00670 [Bacteroidales bacterium Barb4]